MSKIDETADVQSVRPDAREPWLVISSAGGVRAIPLPRQPRVVIGRMHTCDIVIDDDSVSREHAALHTGGGLVIEDLGSRNKTKVMGRTLSRGDRANITVGSVVEIGYATMFIQVGRPAHARSASISIGGLPAGAGSDGADGAAAAGGGAAGGRGGAAGAGAGARGTATATAGTGAAGAGAAGAGGAFGGGAAAAGALGAGAPGTASAAGPVILDPTMQRMYALLDVIAPSPLNVLVLGETGTGKEVFAETLHAKSSRAHAPFLRVNCAALSGSLLESELFGHEKGAFTGALGAKAGLFEAADGGTVFLDEVGELPIDTQAKLLRVIERGEVIRLGSVQPRRVDVRYVAATNRDLQQLIAESRFRSDLFFRLNGFSLTLPPLRKRRREIVPLARLFLARAAHGRPHVLTPAAEAALEAYPWPGNVRELKNVLERAMVLAGAAGRVEPMHLHLPENPYGHGSPAAGGADDDEIRGSYDSAPPMAAAAPAGAPFAGASHANASDLRAQRESWERQQILGALEKTMGNQKEAAKLLGISRRTLINKIEAYGIARPRKR